MPRIYPDLQFRNQSSYTTSTSSSEFDSFGDRLISSVNMEEIDKHRGFTDFARFINFLRP